MHFKRRGGRIVIVGPAGKQPTPSTKLPPAVLKAVVQAYKWSQMLARGEYATVADIAAMGLDKSYASKVLRPTLLAPNLIDAIVWEAEPEGLAIERLLRPFPPCWQEQRARGSRIITGGEKNPRRACPLLTLSRRRFQTRNET